MKKILCLCFSPTLQRTINFENLQLTKVNRSKNYICHASGKAVNSARVLNQLQKGCSRLLCPLGEKNQELFINLAIKDQMDISYVTIPGFTRECWTLLDRTKGTTTELVVNEPLPQDLNKIAGAEIKILKYINDSFDDIDAVLLSGSRPEIWSKDLYPTIAGMTHDAKKLFLADFTGQEMQRTLKTVTPDIIKINEEEFTQTFGTKSENLKEDIISKSQKLQNIIIVTRGEKSTFAAKAGSSLEIMSQKVSAINTIACGDTFNAGFLYEYLNSGDFKAALEKGVWCAARNAESEIPGSIL